MPSLIHNSKSNYRRPGSPVDTQNRIVGVSVGERRETRAATPLVFSNFRSVWQRERLAHVERMHMATPPPSSCSCYTSAIDLHLRKEGGVSLH